MIKEFKIDHSISIKGEGYCYDLHNSYDFKGIKLEWNEKSRLEVFFNKTHGEWTKDDDPEIIVIIFEGIISFETSQSFFSNKSETIEEIGYKDSNDNNYDWLLSEEQMSNNSSIVFRLENDEYLRVNSIKVKVISL